MKQTLTTNRRLVLAERPEGAPTESTLTLKTEDVPSPQEGEMLLRTEFLSLDPYMRGRMSDAPSYAPPVAIGDVMVGGTVAQVAISKLDGFKKGEWVLPQLNTGARVPVCGLVSQSNATSLPEGPDRIGYLMGQILRKRITMRGFIIFEDFGAVYPEFAAEMGGWLKAGKIHYREEIVEGLENAPATSIGMLDGDNFGKCVIRVGPSN